MYSFNWPKFGFCDWVVTNEVGSKLGHRFTDFSARKKIKENLVLKMPLEEKKSGFCELVQLWADVSRCRMNIKL